MNVREKTAREGGFTLIEVLVAMMILAVALMSLLSMIGTTMRAVELGKRQTQAVNLAVEKLEMLKSIPYRNLQADGPSCTCASGCGDCSVQRDCDGSSPSFTCRPNGPDGSDSDPFVTIGNATYKWTWNVTYIDLDDDGVLVEANGIADARDLKRIDLKVEWADLMGPHDLTLTVLRKI